MPKLILYHGSPDNFDKPKIDKKLFGFYTSTSEEVAKIYASRHGFVHKYELQPDAKLLDLSYGYDIINFMIKNEIFDDDEILPEEERTDGHILQDSDLENYILQGQLFQYDIASKTRYADKIMYAAIHKKYDVVMFLDDLGGRGDNIAWVILNITKLITLGSTEVRELKESPIKLKNLIPKTI
jgi:hypothetical protein